MDNSTEPKFMAFLRRQVPLLAGLDDETLLTIARDFRPKTYQKDEIIFQQGDTNREFYVVQKGRVRIYRISPAGGETSIIIFQPGDVVGEFAAIDKLPRSATAEAMGRCQLLEMSDTRFLHHLRHFPDLALAMTLLLTQKIRWTAAYAESVAQYDAAGRLLHTLLLYKDQCGIELEPGKQYLLDLPLTQTTLASLIGARREWVNRLLQDWRKHGLIEYKAGKITILDLPRAEAERDSRIEAHVIGGDEL